MLRRSNIFYGHIPTFVAPTLEDCVDATEEKWRSWIKSESFKRSVTNDHMVPWNLKRGQAGYPRLDGRRTVFNDLSHSAFGVAN